MRTINSKKQELIVGTKLVVIKPYHLGTIDLIVGNVGIITAIDDQSLAVFSLFDIKMYEIDFFNCKVQFTEIMIDEYMKRLKN